VTIYWKGSASDVTPTHRSLQRVSNQVDTGGTFAMLGGKQMEHVKAKASRKSADKTV